MKRHLGQLISLICGGVLCLLSVLYQEPSQVSGFQEWCRVLSNGALVPGVLLTGISCMVWIAGEGLFEGIKYATSSMLSLIWGRNKQYATFYDYSQREKKQSIGYPMLLPGLFFLAAAVVLTLLYYLS